MKTRHPLILTTRSWEGDLAPFDLLRRTHFPPERNFLGAHLTMFRRLPGQQINQIIEQLGRVAESTGVIVCDRIETRLSSQCLGDSCPIHAGR
ncbi:hypothetical protein B9J07_33025 [Sinorhizobium sp. LM21]|nr:hypothetical protein B9J07_33025 [Sinorhizobium sp. LM21]